jgi:hypothetical protein
MLCIRGSRIPMGKMSSLPQWEHKAGIGPFQHQCSAPLTPHCPLLLHSPPAAATKQPMTLIIWDPKNPNLVTLCSSPLQPLCVSLLAKLAPAFRLHHSWGQPLEIRKSDFLNCAPVLD